MLKRLRHFFRPSHHPDVHAVPRAQLQEVGRCNGAHSGSQKKSESYEWLNFLREEVRFEYNLTAQRVAWFLTSQTFLVSAFILGYANKGSFTNVIELFTQVIPGIGSVSSMLLRASIFVSHRRIWEHSHNIMPYHNPNHYSGLSDSLRGVAMLYARLVPTIFFGLWLSIGFVLNGVTIESCNVSRLFVTIACGLLIGEFIIGKFEKKIQARPRFYDIR